MQSADFLSAVFFYLKVGENLNQNWIVENLNNAFSTWNGKLGELWGLVTTGPQTFKGGAVWSVMQTLHNGMVGIGYALVVLFFAISLCKNTMNFHELKRPEAAIHYFLRFVAAKALVGYGMDIMLNVFSMPPPQRRAYLTHLNRCKVMDSYHRALIYALTAVPALRYNIDACFNFEKDEIKPESLAAGWQTSGTTKLTRFAYNLWNGYDD